MNVLKGIARLFVQEQTRPLTSSGALRIYVVGDIHGRHDLLEILHDKIRKDLAVHPHAHPRLVYLGDYIDRGLDSRKVLDTLINAPMQGFEIDYLKGNHEQSLLSFLQDPQAGAGWLAIGGQGTLFSYGVPAPKGVASVTALAEIQQNFLKALPLQHVAFLDNLKLSVSYGDFFFAHAGVRPGVPLAEQSDKDLLWIRDDFIKASKAYSKIVIHGHTVVSEPEFRPNRIGLDTGAFATGILSCLVLDGDQMRLLQTP